MLARMQEIDRERIPSVKFPHAKLNGETFVPNNLSKVVELRPTFDPSLVPNLPMEQAQKSFEIMVRHGVSKKWAHEILVAVDRLRTKSMSDEDTQFYLCEVGLPQQAAENIVRLIHYYRAA